MTVYHVGKLSHAKLDISMFLLALATRIKLYEIGKDFESELFVVLGLQIKNIEIPFEIALSIRQKLKSNPSEKELIDIVKYFVSLGLKIETNEYAIQHALENHRFVLLKYLLAIINK